MYLILEIVLEIYRPSAILGRSCITIKTLPRRTTQYVMDMMLVVAQQLLEEADLLALSDSLKYTRGQK